MTIQIPLPKAQSPLSNAYTDSPDLHPNLLIASVQILVWLFFHPSAWRNYIVRIDPKLRSDLWLIDLRAEHWRKPQVWRLVLIGYVIWPLFAGLLITIIGWLTDRSNENLAVIVAGLAAGIVVVIVTGGMAGHQIVGSLARPAKHFSLTKQIGGITLGILIGGMTVVMVVAMKSVTANFATGFMAVVMAGGVTVIVTGGLAFSISTHHWRQGITVAVAATMVAVVVALAMAGVTDGVASNVAGGIAFGWIIAALFALSYVIAARIGDKWAGVVAGTIGSGGIWIAIAAFNGPTPRSSSIILGVLATLAGLTLSLWRPVILYPLVAAWNTVLLRREERRAVGQPALLRYHAAFWDEQQRLPWPGLADHVVLVYERDPVEALTALNYLSTGRQRWAAQAAQIELDARHLERHLDARIIRRVHHTLTIRELAGPASAILHTFSRISQDIDAVLEQESNYNQRLALSAVEDRLDAFLRELTRSNERYAVRFRPIATAWQQAVTEHIQRLATSIEERQEIDSPYVLGVPLTVQQEIFVGRTDISARIEQLLLDRRRPPLLLYGQRRMGKTSLLNNLGRLLPSTIIPLFVDLQGPATRASEYSGLLYNVARGMVESAQRQRGFALPALLRESLTTDPFTVFDEWLDQVEHTLGDHTALLMLDEFEALESAMQRGRYDEEDMFGLLRHLIQHRPRFKVLLAGSHTLAEYQRWASYLINVQTVHISYLKEEEARQLIERPVKEFTLRYEANASQRIIDLTCCHPFLVQLLCSELVALKNEQDPSVRRLATLADVEAAAPEALAHGSMFFADLEHNQVNEAGRTVLRQLAACGEGGIADRAQLAQNCPDPINETLKLLQQRELIEPVEGGYRFQVELIRRWFVQ